MHLHDITNEKSFTYIRGQLHLSDKTLSNSLELMNLESGKVYALAPIDVTQEQLYKFENGGLYYDEKIEVDGVWLSHVTNRSIPDFVELINKHLALNSDNCCVFEEPILIPTDTKIIQSGIHYLHNGEEVYYFVSKEINSDKIEKFRLQADDYYFLSVLSSIDLSRNKEMDTVKKIDSTILKTIANNCSLFVVKAYDGEGFIMWAKYPL